MNILRYYLILIIVIFIISSLFRYFQFSNKIGLKPNVGSSSEGIKAESKEVKSKHIPKEEAAKNLPKALIIGAPKCGNFFSFQFLWIISKHSLMLHKGSTGLREFIAIHPEIKVHGGEPNFFNLIQFYRRGVEWYKYVNYDFI